MEQSKLDKILADHAKFIKDETEGIKADLRRADLRRADLRDADLRDADLRWANLRGADLRDADLRDADLRWANLRGANLRRADLSWANLRGANLIIFRFNRDTAYYQFDGMIRIGCEYHSIQHWIDTFEAIGKNENYTDVEIEVYGNFINTCMMLEDSNDNSTDA